MEDEFEPEEILKGKGESMEVKAYGVGLVEFLKEDFSAGNAAKAVREEGQNLWETIYVGKGFSH
ncbi:MAG: hypothetical protein Q4F41_19310 [Eubacteriales bacterium]|nr:hypothetical protein [Eubacteriales bacterium]